VLDRLERGHEVLAMSLPGYGESPPLEEEPTVPALVDAVERELDSAGWDTAHIVGNSMGGWITAELAARGRARSGVAIDPAGLWTP
jgi:pimeloyl-ACP methyl ester carboxylesterase